MDVHAWLIVTLLVDIISLVFQIAAYAAPMWRWLQNDSIFHGIGLWYYVGCTESAAICQGSNLYRLALWDAGPFLAVRVLQSVGTAGLLILTVFLVVMVVGHSGKWNSMLALNTASFVLAIVTFLILLASTVVFCAYYWPHFNLANTYNRSSLPWSAMMSFLAVLILIIVIIFIRAFCRPKKYYGHNIPMSGDTKMEMNPYVMNGDVPKYFNGTPYSERPRYVVEDRRAHVPRGYYDDRPYHENRAYLHEVEPVVAYHKPASSVFKDNKDREMGHTIYTENGFSYLEDTSRQDRDSRKGRQIALVEYPRDDSYDPYYSRGGVRYGSNRALPALPTSSMYMYRPYHGQY